MSFTISAYICAYNYEEAIIYHSFACKDENWMTLMFVSQKPKTNWGISSPFTHATENEPISDFIYPLFPNLQYLQIYIHQTWVIYYRILKTKLTEGRNLEGCTLYFLMSLGPKMFCTSQGQLQEAVAVLVLVQMFLAIPKIEVHLLLIQKFCAGTKYRIYWLEIIYWSGSKSSGTAQYVNQCLVWCKNIGLVQKYWTGTYFFGTCRRKRH